MVEKTVTLGEFRKLTKDIRSLGFKFKNYKYNKFKGMKIYRCELK